MRNNLKQNLESLCSKLIKIANIQKRTARMILDNSWNRMILDKSWNHSSTPLFNELKWLPLQSCITYHVELLVFKIHL